MIEKQSIDYEAVLADLEERRSGLDSAIAAIKQIIQQGSASGISPATSSHIGINGQNIPGDAFFQMSIVDATKETINSTDSRCVRKGWINPFFKKFLCYSFNSANSTIKR
jgi:hypothetical protein